MITGSIDAEYLNNLRAVLQAMKDNNLKLEGLKGSFMVDAYLGFELNKEDMSTLEAKIRLGSADLLVHYNQELPMR